MVTPLFGVRVPVRPHALADPEKGTGVGNDLHVRRRHRRDVVARTESAGPRDHSAERRVQAGDVGRARMGVGRRGSRAQAHYDQLAGLSAVKARARIVDQLKASGDLLGDPRPITHAVKFYEKGDRPLEIVTSRQWFVKTMEFREELLARGRELQLAPAVHAGAVRELDQRPGR